MKTRRTTWIERLLPVAVASLMIGLTALVYLAERRVQEERRLLDAKIVSTNFAARLETHVAARLNAASLLALHTDQHAPISFETFVEEAMMFHTKFGDLQALNWVDSSGIIQIVTPMQGNEAALGLNLKGLPLPSATLDQAIETEELQVTPPITLAQGGRGFVAYLPVWSDEHLAGFLNVVFKTKALIENALGTVETGPLNFRVYDGDTLLFSSLQAEQVDEFVVESDLKVGSRTWRIEVSPGGLPASGVTSRLDEAILILGFLLTFCAVVINQVLIRRRLELEHSNARFHDFATASSDWFWEMDETLRTTWFSPGIEDFFGVSRKELLGRSRGDFRLPMGDDEKWQRHYEDLQNRQSFKDFLYAIATQGEIKWVRASGMPIFDERNRFLGYRGTASDATELVKSRTQVEEGNARLANAVENLDELFSLWDFDDKLVICNRIFRELNADISEFLVPGTSFEDFLRASVRAGHMPDIEGREEAFIAASLRQRHSSDGKPFEITRTDGVALKLHEQKLEGGGIVTIGRDVTKEYRRDQELRESQERLALAVRTLSIWDWDLVADTLYISPGFAEALEYTEEDLDAIKAGSFENYIHPEDLEGHRAKIRDHLQNPTSPFTNEYRVRAKDGTYRWFMARGHAVFDEDSRVLRSTGVLTDVTEQVELEQKLQQAQKMEAIGNLTGGVAHDFNNLLAVVLGNLELIQETDELAEINRFAEAGIKATRRGAELTKNMLSFARKSRLQPKPTDLNQLVEETQSWAERVLPANISIELALGQKISKVEIDPGLAQNALLNLILNSRDAMPRGGKLTIETSHCQIDTDYIDTEGEPVPPGRYVMLAVSDTGEGIPKENMSEIFAPFFTSKPTGSGSGLGLSMVQGFMKQSGGAVRAYSELGIGTSIKLFFQANVPSVPSEVDDVVDQHGFQRHDAHLLVVEDEPAVLDVLTETLTKVGYQVTTASSGDMAYEIWKKGANFDLLVTDIVMPGELQGTHLAKALRADRTGLPVVFLSGYAAEATIHGNGLRPDDIRLMKPARRSDLVAAVEKALSDSSQ